MDAVKVDFNNLEDLNNIDKGVLCYSIISDHDIYNTILFSNGSNFIYSYYNNSFYFMENETKEMYTERLKKTVRKINADVSISFNKCSINAEKNIKTLTAYEKKYRK